MIVDRISSALQHLSHGFSDSDQVMSDSEDNVNASSEDEESMEPMEPDDTMMLVQY